MKYDRNMNESNIYVFKVRKYYFSVDSWILESLLICFVDMLSEIDCVNSMLVENNIHITDWHYYA